MLDWALGFLTLAVIVTFLGMADLTIMPSGLAQTLCSLFLVAFAVTYLVSLFRGRPVRPGRN